ncbi:hypothetical protein Pcinc_035802 [Petrolisthes cinctipes]|uniref:Uncharacterized protein n=1 Tax=Petrolisthes cinctipes TaxID=88211 RepID=A0AAE1BW95_PETCI|nr:hypothetical protein Pcinc_035802 [Petrolisthes cinctipes]
MNQIITHLLKLSPQQHAMSRRHTAGEVSSSNSSNNNPFSPLSTEQLRSLRMLPKMFSSKEWKEFLAKHEQDDASERDPGPIPILTKRPDGSLVWWNLLFHIPTTTTTTTTTTTSTPTTTTTTTTTPTPSNPTDTQLNHQLNTKTLDLNQLRALRMLPRLFQSQEWKDMLAKEGGNSSTYSSHGPHPCPN